MYRSPLGRCFSTAFEVVVVLVLVVPNAVVIVLSVGMILRDAAWDLLRGMMITDLGVVAVVVSSIFSFSSSSTSLVIFDNIKVSGISPFSSIMSKMVL